MKTIPVEQARVGAFHAAGVAAVLDSEGVQKRREEDQAGAFKVECLVRPVQVGDFVPKIFVLEVKVWAHEKPTFLDMARIEFVGLVARPWEFTTSDGREKHGVAFSAESVVLMKAPGVTAGPVGEKAAK